MKTNNSGFTLVEVMLALAIAAAGALGLMKMFENSTKAQKTIEIKDDISQIHREVTSLLSIEKNCRASLEGKINNSTVGTHQLSKENLELYNITKHELNINTIYNFMIIVYSDWSIGNNNSYFWRMARYINDVGINKYSKWLNSYIPDYIPSTYKHIINYKELTAKKKNIYYRMRR